MKAVENIQEKEKTFRILMGEKDVKNLIAFLNRVNLTGKEVPAFLSIKKSIIQAEDFNNGTKEEKTEKTQ